MLRTAGFSPVAQEFSCASREGSSGSDIVPVAPECPITAIESSASVVTGVGEALSASGVVEAAYFFALTRAYRLGDFSLVYPLARGAAPAFLALWATIFLAERPSPVSTMPPHQTAIPLALARSWMRTASR